MLSFKFRSQRIIKILKAFITSFCDVVQYWEDILELALRRSSRTTKPWCLGSPSLVPGLLEAERSCQGHRLQLRGTQWARTLVVSGAPNGQGRWWYQWHPKGKDVGGTRDTTYSDAQSRAYLSPLKVRKNPNAQPPWTVILANVPVPALQKTPAEEGGCAGASGTRSPLTWHGAVSAVFPAVGHVWGCLGAWHHLFSADQPAGEGRGQASILASLVFQGSLNPGENLFTARRQMQHANTVLNAGQASHTAENYFLHVKNIPMGWNKQN